MNITRRSALLGTAAAVSFAAPVAMAAYLNQASDPVVVLERQWRDMLEESHRLSNFYRQQYNQLPAWAKSREDQSGRQVWGWPDVSDLPEFREYRSWLFRLSTRPSLHEVRNYNRQTESLATPGGEEHARRRTEGRARVRAWIGRQREKKALERELGIHDWDKRVDDPFYFRLFAIERQIIDTPARSLAGIAVKLRLHVHYGGYEDMQPEEIDWNDELVFAVLRDAERLSGEASS